MTQRRLVLVRHAKSADGPVEIERPLTARGLRDATAVGRSLAQAGIVPDRIIVSPALRARQTWQRAQPELTATTEVVVDARIYDNDVALLFEVIRDTPADVHTLALIGHNPSFAELALVLDPGTGDEDARRDVLAGYPTGGVAVFEISAPWDEMRPGSATLMSFTVPRAP